MIEIIVFQEQYIKTWSFQICACEHGTGSVCA